MNRLFTIPSLILGLLTVDGCTSHSRQADSGADVPTPRPADTLSVEQRVALMRGWVDSVITSMGVQVAADSDRAVSAAAGELARSPRDTSPARASGPSNSRLTYRAATRAVGREPLSLRTTATVTNAGSRAVELEIAGGCPVLLRAYRSAERTGTPAWDGQLPRAHRECTASLQRFPLDPGKSRSFNTTVTAPAILGDSLPAGRYFFSAIVQMGSGNVAVAAGDANLRRTKT